MCRPGTIHKNPGRARVTLNAASALAAGSVQVRSVRMSARARTPDVCIYNSYLCRILLYKNNGDGLTRRDRLFGRRRAKTVPGTTTVLLLLLLIERIKQHRRRTLTRLKRNIYIYIF